jgi:hypothetical protein
MVTNMLKWLYHGLLVTAVCYNTWSILKINAAINAIVGFIVQHVMGQ